MAVSAADVRKSVNCAANVFDALRGCLKPVFPCLDAARNLQQARLNYISTNTEDREEKLDLAARTAFAAADSSGDGYLDVEELIAQAGVEGRAAARLRPVIKACYINDSNPDGLDEDGFVGLNYEMTNRMAEVRSAEVMGGMDSTGAGDNFEILMLYTAINKLDEEVDNARMETEAAVKETAVLKEALANIHESVAPTFREKLTEWQGKLSA